MKRYYRRSVFVLISIFTLLVMVGETAWAHPQLKQNRFVVPPVPGLSKYVKNKKAATALGKALFWDQNIGSDGMACASCHFHAGADSRKVNQLHFKNDRVGEIPNTPNVRLTRDDFPLIKIGTNNQVIYETDNVVSSSGSLGGVFNSVTEQGSAPDDCTHAGDNGGFNVGGVHTRRVEPRNTPTVINAVFNFRNFWDGRANNIFNGSTPFGDRDAEAGVWVLNGGAWAKEVVRLKNSSLASQAVGPPLSDLEMSCSGRTFADVGRRVIKRQALEAQAVHAQDSLLASLRDGGGKGLKKTYEALIKQAFNKKYWAGTGTVNGTSYTQMEANFSLFFGLAIQMYEATLIADQSAFDKLTDEEIAAYDRAFDASSGANTDERLLNTHNKLPKAKFSREKLEVLDGLRVFGDAHCTNCHNGPTFSVAAFPEVVNKGKKKKEVETLVNRTKLLDGNAYLVDVGFANTGVTPESFDPGLGSLDPNNREFSLASQYQEKLKGGDPRDLDVISSRVDPCKFIEPFVGDASIFVPVPCPQGNVVNLPRPEGAGVLAVSGAVGAFKVPTLTNVELTGPYMHNGGLASLEEVVDFYIRTGNYSDPALNPHKNVSDMPLLVGGSVNVGAYGKKALVTFLKSLTDERVRRERAPFDHPELTVPNGHVGDSNQVNGLAGLAEDRFIALPAVGKAGRLQDAEPLGSFEDMLHRGRVSSVSDSFLMDSTYANRAVEVEEVSLNGSAPIVAAVGAKAFYDKDTGVTWQDDASDSTGGEIWRGWVHNSKLLSFRGEKGMQVSLRMTKADTASGVHPAFVVFHSPDGIEYRWPKTECPQQRSRNKVCLPSTDYFPQQGNWRLQGLPKNPKHKPSDAYALLHVASGWDNDLVDAAHKFLMPPVGLDDIAVSDGKEGELTSAIRLPYSGDYLLIISNAGECSEECLANGSNLLGGSKAIAVTLQTVSP